MNNPKMLLCMQVLLFSILTRAANFIEYYVSPTGSGSAFTQGTPGALYSARDKVRLVNAGMSGDIVVYLCGGTYELDSTFVLRPEDSGNNGFSVVYRAVPGDIPVISGGKRITGWTLFDASKNIFRANTGTSLQTRQLYVNGVRAVRARGPQNPSGFSVTATGFSTSDTSMQHWRNVSDIEIVSFKEWKAFRGGVASISGSDIVMKQPYWNCAKFHTDFAPEGVTWVENAYELLDAPGEWYFDRGEGRVYYRPRAGEDLSSAEVIVPVLETLVSGEGTLDLPLHHVKFSGISFAYATWMKPSSDTGHAVVQSDVYFVGQGWALVEKTPGNIRFDASYHIAFERNAFAHLGAAALDFEYGSQYNQVIGNLFTDISGNGIQIGGILAADRNPTDLREICKGNTISDNLIDKIGAEYFASCGIIGYFADSTIIEHNELSNLPYSGISMGWAWDDGAEVSKNNKIRYNLIHHYMRMMKDGGGVYTLGAQPGTEISYNYFHDWQGPSTDMYGALYMDQGSSYMHWHHNAVSPGSALWMFSWTWPQIHDDTVDNNYFDVDASRLNGANSSFVNNTLVTSGNWPPEALAIMAGAGLEAAYANIRPVVPSAPPPALLLRLPFDETSGLVALDLSGNSYSGAFDTGTWTAGRIGGGLELDGTHNVLMAGPAGPMPAFTVAFWIYPHTHVDWNQAIGLSWGQFTFHTTADGSIYCGTDVNTRFTPTQLPAGTLALNTWQHFAFTFDNGNAAFYKNGEKLAEMTQSMPQDWTGFGIGSVDGIIDEMRVYRGALDSAFVAVLAQGRDSLVMTLPAQKAMGRPRLEAGSPFSQIASISFSVPGDNSIVSLIIFTVDGKQVARLVNGKRPKGDYRVKWNAAGRPAGLYLCRLEAGGKKLSKRLVLAR